MIDVKRLLEPIQRATIDAYTRGRDERKLFIEAAIVQLRPDAIEASELIDAISAGLKLRYDNPSEVLLRMSLLKGDLERLDQCREIDASDVLNAYERAVERKGG